MIRCVVYIHDPNRHWSLTSRSNSCICFWPITSVYFDIDIPYFGTWVYHHERMCCVPSWSWYYVDLWLQGQIYRVYDMALCSGHSFLSFDTVTLCFASECITMVQCVGYIHYLSMTLTWISKLNFHQEFESGKILFVPWQKHTKFWHMGVSPWDNILCTFLTLVWPFLLTYMWVAGVSIVSSTHSFYLVDQFGIIIIPPANEVQGGI